MKVKIQFSEVLDSILVPLDGINESQIYKALKSRTETFIKNHAVKEEDVGRAENPTLISYHFTTFTVNRSQTYVNFENKWNHIKRPPFKNRYEKALKFVKFLEFNCYIFDSVPGRYQLAKAQYGYGVRLLHKKCRQVYQT